MEVNSKGKFNLGSYKASVRDMVAASDDAWSMKSEFGGFSRNIQLSKDYSIEEIEAIVLGSSVSQKQRLSQTYFSRGGFYKRIIMYYSTLLKYSGLLIPNPQAGKKLSNKFIQKKYDNAVNYLEDLSLPVLLGRFTQKILTNGCYYGAIIKNDRIAFSVLDLPAEYCDTNFTDIYGNEVVDFNVSYFDSLLDGPGKAKALKVYPKSISSYYYLWKAGKKASSWMQVPTQDGICFSFFGKTPLFLASLVAIEQYSEAVETERQRALEEIRKLIVLKVPHLNDGQLLFEPEEAAEIHKAVVQMLKGNKNLSVFTTYTDVDSVVSKSGAEGVNNNDLAKMSQNIYSEVGVSGQLFSATGGMSIEASIQNDVSLMMHLANKFALFVTKLINEKFSNSSVNFKFTIFPITHYNESDFIADSFKLAQSGYSQILPAIASGFSQRDLGNIKGLENDYLNLAEILKPLSSAYTQSGSDDVGGAPSIDDADASPKTIKNKESMDRPAGGLNGNK